MSHQLLILLLLIAQLGWQPCQATVEDEGGHHQQGVVSVQEQKDSGGTHHGGGHPKDAGGTGHGGGSDGAEAAGVHKEAGHHGEVRKFWTLTNIPSWPEDAKFSSANSSLSHPDIEFVNGS